MSHVPFWFSGLERNSPTVHRLALSEPSSSGSPFRRQMQTKPNPPPHSLESVLPICSSILRMALPLFPLVIPLRPPQKHEIPTHRPATGTSRYIAPGCLLDGQCHG